MLMELIFLHSNTVIEFLLLFSTKNQSMRIKYQHKLDAYHNVLLKKHSVLLAFLIIFDFITYKNPTLILFLP